MFRSERCFVQRLAASAPQRSLRQLEICFLSKFHQIRTTLGGRKKLKDANHATLEQIHKDDLHELEQDPALDDLLPISGNGQWHLQLTAVEDGEDPSEAPDWFGYRPI